MNNIYLSVVIPCYNEIENLKRGVLNQIKEFLEKQDYSWEVIVSDDGSTDKSLKFVKEFIKKNQNLRALENPHAGKPFAVWAGIKASKGKYVLFTDMDQSTPISEINKLLPYFEKDFDLVIGSRGEERKGFPWYRKILATGFRMLRRAIILSKIVDTQCGFKAFKREVAQDVFKRLQVFKEEKKAKGWKVTAFDVELLFIAQKRGYKIAEVPVRWTDVDIAKGKKRNFMKESWGMAKEILRVKLNDLRHLYEI